MYSVVSDVFDIDKTLFVVKSENIHKNNRSYFTGTQKECRKFVIDNQGKTKTPSVYTFPKFNFNLSEDKFVPVDEVVTVDKEMKIR